MVRVGESRGNIRGEGEEEEEKEEEKDEKEPPRRGHGSKCGIFALGFSVGRSSRSRGMKHMGWKR